MILNLSNETVENLKSVAVLLNNGSISIVANAILQKECLKIINLAKKEGLNVETFDEQLTHEPHASIEDTEVVPDPKEIANMLRKYAEEIPDEKDNNIVMQKQTKTFADLGPSIGEAPVNFLNPQLKKKIRRN